MVLRGYLVAILLCACACGDDRLLAITHPATPLSCAPGTAEQAGTCVTIPGRLLGRICDPATGLWLGDSDVSLGEGWSTITDPDGRFTISDIAPGRYFITIGADETVVEIKAGEDTVLADGECLLPPGHIRGRVCDEARGTWLGDASVTLADTAFSTTTDAFGRFVLFAVPGGSYSLRVVKDAFVEETEVTVAPDVTLEFGDSACTPLPRNGVVQGRICGGDGYWLSGANVAVQLADGTFVQATTDAEGKFRLEGLPAGTYTVQVTKGSFSTTFEVTLASDSDVIEMSEPICIPPTTRMAVVTGVYDHVERILENLGYRVRARYLVAGAPELVDETGSIDIIHGDPNLQQFGMWSVDADSMFWIRDFLADAEWLGEYDIVFFNCGLNDSDLATGTTYVDPAIYNLRQFTQNGGSVYASDWAAELLRMAFPQRLGFRLTNGYGASRVGLAAASQPADVVEPGLAIALGTNQVTVNMNLDMWTLLAARQSQPTDLTVLLTAAVRYANPVDCIPFFGCATELATQAETPLIVYFGYGEGRVLFTSAHHEAQTTQDLRDILNYVIFEL